MTYYLGMTEDKFVDYITKHSKTQKKTFPKAMVAEMLSLAGRAEEAEEVMKDPKGWHKRDMSDLVSEYHALAAE